MKPNENVNQNSQGNYSVKQRTTIAEAPGLRVRLFTLDEGQCVPWHYHNNTADIFFCMNGRLQITTRNPDETHILEPGGSCTIDPGTVHHVEGHHGQYSRFMIVQGVGKYDYVPVDA